MAPACVLSLSDAIRLTEFRNSLGLGLKICADNAVHKRFLPQTILTAGVSNPGDDISWHAFPNALIVNSTVVVSLYIYSGLASRGWKYVHNFGTLIQARWGVQ